MKKLLKKAILTLIICFFISNVYTAKASAYILSSGECVIEVQSGRILSSYNENAILPMASTTKILTALTVIENFSVDTVVTIPKSAVGIEGSSIYLREGEKLSVKELLYGLMLRSGNDCAEALAQTLVSRDEFIKLMNDTAKKAGAKNSNFTNPHGLHDKNHYTTALDLCLISSKAMKNSIFKEIVSTKKVSISNDGYSYDRVLINKNKLLFNYDGCTGVKTGYTKNAGRCLVSSAVKNGLEVVCVVINSPQMWERSKELLDFSFNNYKMVNLIDKNDFDNKIFKDKNNKSFAIELSTGFKYPLKNDEISKIKYKCNGKNFDDFINNPQNSAVFEIFIENELIFSQNIFTIK